MSDENVEIVRRAFEDACRVTDPSGRTLDVLDPDALAVVFDFLHPEVEVEEDPRFPEAGLYRGREAAARYFTQFTESFNTFTFESEEFIGLDDGRVLVLFRLRMRGRGSAVPVEARPGWIYTVRDGKAARIEAHLDRNEAFAAAGLPAR